MGLCGVLRDVLPQVPRPTLSRDEPPFLLVEERPVPRSIARHAQEVRIHARLCKMQETVARNLYSHPSLAHSQDCRTRIEAASRRDPVYRDRAERAEQRSMDCYAKWKEMIIQGEPHWNRVSCLDHHLERVPRSDPEGEGRSFKCLEMSNWSVESHNRTPSSSTSIPISPGASSSSGVKRTYSESTALPNSPECLVR